MKKLIVVMLSALLAMALVVPAFAADITMGGDARVRGMWIDNADANDDAADKIANWDERFRLKIEAELDSGTKVMTRIKVADGDWGTNQAEGDGGPMISTDYAYLVIPYQSVTLTVGAQLGSWGNKFMAWNGEVDRFKVTTKMDNVTLGGFIQKTVEANQTFGSADMDGYSVFAVGSFDNAKAGIIAIYVNNEVASDADGYIVDVFGNGAVGEIGLDGELVFRGGDMYDVDGADMGAYVAANMKMDQVGLGLTLAYAADGFVADDDWTPTLLIGTTQANAIMNFGQGVDDSSDIAIVLSADFGISDALSAGAKIAYIMSEVGAWDGDLIEIDAFMNYALTSDTDWFFGAAYGMPSDYTATDDEVMSFAHKIEVKF